ncbi:MAG: isoprenylcysteine carboxylmethyltransferase family protein [Firmicutes bacterium]|nr:isoprenylcysteine carboxylmethyltransferase family protein [Bacillota bacterium]
MDVKLFLDAVLKFISGVLIAGILVFLPAGSLAFHQGWLFMTVVFLPIFFVGLVIMIKSPELMRKRLESKEKQSQQNVIVKISAVMFVTGFIIAGLNFRFGWLVLPEAISVVGVVFYLVSYVIYAEVLRENAYLSRVIEVQEGQKVVDTGLYSVVRHPMYSATVILFLSMPVMLGSLYSFVIFLVYPFIIAKRIKEEEKLLENELEGYRKYKEKVKYKLIPFIW